MIKKSGLCQHHRCNREQHSVQQKSLPSRKDGTAREENYPFPDQIAALPVEFHRKAGKVRAVQDPLAAFGLASGMVFPVLMFPACILYALAELLIPEPIHPF